MMNPFVYDIPTKVYFGPGKLEHLSAELAALGKRVLLCYGGGSIKRSGLYDRVVAQIQGAGLELWELPGIDPNPRVTSVRQGAQLCKEHGIDVVLADVVPQSSVAYEQEKCGYFRTSRYCSRKHIEGADHIIGTIKGKGHLVCSVITGYGSYDGEITCEGDVRIHTDGIGTPQIESDGSESHACYGWGFATPPETNPFSGYDGRPNSPWCQVRTFLTDPIPFLTELRFGIESGGNNDQYMEHSGVLMYYGTEMPGMVLTDEIDIGDENSRRSHRYVSEGNIGAVRLASYYEGDEDHVEIRDETILFTARSSFQVRIIPENTGIRLRRRSDQLKKRQEARVWVDGVPVEERTWYFADGNPYKRWLEDEFEIPEKYTRGKETLSVSIEPLVQENGDTVWNEYHYWVFSKT